MIIFEAWYRECIYESAPTVISLHRTIEGATEAMEAHKQEIVRECEEANRVTGSNWTVEDFEAWGVKEHKVLD